MGAVTNATTDALARDAVTGGSPRTALAAGTGRPRAHNARRDIQGLRAVAVGLVVLYHLRPDKLPGGFAGVDVFLVISGYLIVGSLAREAVSTGSISLRSFYARRIRRLLPASTLVLLVTLAATLLLMPPSRWKSASEGVIASALQVQNWALAAGSGYANAAQAASPLQHYWSLAVEEQFYLLAPFVLLLALWLAARSGRPRPSLIVALMAALAVASFVHSVTFSTSHHAVAYYATTTRMWELAAGGLLALSAHHLRLPSWAAELCVVTGLVGIAVTGLTFSTDMAFPGWVALLPVAGSVLVILGGEQGADERRAPAASRLLGIRPLRFVGDVSYSLYLWHWPVIVFFVFQQNRTPTKVDVVVLTATCLVLAALTTRFVERPFRVRRERAPGGRAGWDLRSRPFALAGCLLTICLVAGTAPWLYVRGLEGRLLEQQLDAAHPGAVGELPEVLPPVGDEGIVPDPAVAASDIPVVNRDEGCAAFDPRVGDPRGCVYGDEGSPLSLVLVGDSHAAQFSTPLATVAEHQGWALHTMVRNGCPFTGAAQIINGRTDSDCADANAVSRDEILRMRPQLVVTTAMNPTGYEDALGWTWTSREALVEGYRELWAPIAEAGIPVVVIRDTPTPSYSGPECVSRNGPESPACSMTRAEAVDDQPDPQVEAAQDLAGVRVLDLSDYFCNQRVCPSVIGNVLVYRDNHVTDTFSRSLAPMLSRALADLV